MRSIALLFALIACTSVGAEPPMLERLKRELKVAAPPEHYPDHADYTLFPEVCNPKICFAGSDRATGPRWAARRCRVCTVLPWVFTGERDTIRTDESTP